MKNIRTPRTLSESLDEWLAYDKDTGIFTWKKDGQGHHIRQGKQAGGVDRYGYVLVGFKGKQYRAHRLAILITSGSWPEHEVDHINHIKTDNRLANLRCATRSLNAQNRQGPTPLNELGVLGVGLHKQSGLYRARLQTNKKQKTLGYFKTIEEASEAYLSAKREMHEGNTL